MAKQAALTSGNSETGPIRLRKEIGLLEGVSIICGIIVGSGIFISPKGVLAEAQSVGLTLTIWILAGALSMLGALCYAELGTTIPKSGGDYAYINEAFGPLPSFLFLWDANVIFVPTTNAIMGLTFAKYVIQPFFGIGCVPDMAVRLIAGSSICFLTFLNCYDVRITTKVQDVFMVAKISGLGIIIVAGLVHIAQGNVQNFENPWKDSQTEVGNIAVCFYSGLFSYTGWSYLNFMTEELKSPYKNLPRAIFISLPLVTLIYTLANVGYLAVLSKQQMLNSEAIAVTFGDNILGSFAWVMPMFVALTTFGSLSVHIMTSSRLLFSGARKGQFPEMLSLINTSRMTPTPALVFLCLLSLCYLSTSDIFALIEYSSFVESSFITLSVGGMIYMRYTRPNIPRPIKINIIIPILFFILCTFLMIVPAYVRPIEVGGGVLITLTGLPFYYLSIWKKPQWLQDMTRCITLYIQKMFISAKEDPKEI